MLDDPCRHRPLRKKKRASSVVFAIGPSSLTFLLRQFVDTALELESERLVVSFFVTLCPSRLLSQTRSDVSSSLPPRDLLVPLLLLDIRSLRCGRQSASPALRSSTRYADLRTPQPSFGNSDPSSNFGDSDSRSQIGDSRALPPRCLAASIRLRIIPQASTSSLSRPLGHVEPPTSSFARPVWNAQPSRRSLCPPFGSQAQSGGAIELGHHVRALARA